MSHPQKHTPLSFPVLDALAHRWSPRAIGPKPVEPEKIASMFEAARWAPSASNLQPWRFLYVTKDDGERRAAVESLLNPANAWAKNAAVLIVSFCATKRKTSDGSEVDNSHALYDLGAAVYSLMLQLPSMGLAGRQMGGFNVAATNELLGVPSDFRPVTMIAVGYPEDPSQLLPVELQEREALPRNRKHQEEFAYRAQWPA